MIERIVKNEEELQAMDKAVKQANGNGWSIAAISTTGLKPGDGVRVTWLPPEAFLNETETT